MTTERNRPKTARAGSPRSTAKAALLVGALGIVFGDIGTSPLYTIATVFNPSDPHPVTANNDAIFGIISMIIWSVIVVVTITYVALIMRADNNGEGGIMALITLVRRQSPGSARTKAGLVALGIFGAALFLGDSMITPAISVLSAVEGLQVVEPSLGDSVVPITVVIIVMLFLLQRIGTASVGRLFGPVMIIWFTAIGACGISGIADHPEILKALSPTYAVDFFFSHFGIAFFALGSVVLAVTGAEALYADMGHFGRKSITRAWILLVFPACILSYMGQGALVLDNPAANISNPFFLLVPEWARWPMVVLATMATVIASQAVITGAFSVARQASQLGYLPRLRILHTSARRAGQIYVPLINWLLMVSVLVLVLTFKNSHALAFAFGMAVTGTITITTLLYLYVVHEQWKKPLWLVLGGGGVLIAIDLFFLAANGTKFFHGAWLPVLVAAVVFTILMTWQRGRVLVTNRRVRAEGSLRDFVKKMHAGKPPVTRVHGTAVFLNHTNETTPLAMRALVERLHTLHEHVVVISIETLGVPHVPAKKRLVLDQLGFADDGITHATARFGYMDHPNVPAVLRLIAKRGTESKLEVEHASYFLSTIELHKGDAPGLSRWRKSLFLATSRITADATEYFCLPHERTVIIGSRVDV